MINYRFVFLLFALFTGFTVSAMSNKGTYYQVPSLRELLLKKLVAIHGPEILESINASNLDETYHNLIANGSLIQDLFRSRLSLFFINRRLPITADRVVSIESRLIRKVCAHPKENLYAFVVSGENATLFFLKQDAQKRWEQIAVTQIPISYYETSLIGFMPNGALIWTSCNKGIHIKQGNSESLIPYASFITEAQQSIGCEKSLLCSKDTIAIGTDRGKLLTAKKTDARWITNMYKLCGAKKIINQLALIAPDCYAAAVGHCDNKKGKVLVIHTNPDFIVISLEESKTEPFTAIACSADGKFLAAARKSTLIIWQKDAENSWQKIKTIEKFNDHICIDLKFLDLPYGRLLIAAGNPWITFFDSNNFKKIGTYKPYAESNCCAFAADGESFFSGCQIHRFSDIRAALFAAVQKKAEDQGALDLAKQTELYRSLSSESVSTLDCMKWTRDRKREFLGTPAGKVRYALKHYRSLTHALFNIFCFTSLGTAWFTHSLAIAAYPWFNTYESWFLFLDESKNLKKTIIPTLIGAGMGCNIAMLIAPHTGKHWILYSIGNIVVLGISTFLIHDIAKEFRFNPKS